MSTVTQWFDGELVPVHVGVYQRGYHANSHLPFCFWDGKFWGSPRLSVEDAYLVREERSIFQNGPSWRGLAVKP